MPDAILDDISHRRYNPLRGSWILVSPHRTKRPWQGQQEAASKTTLPAYDPACYLCPGNTRAAGDKNPAYDATFVFVNDYSAVKESQPDWDPHAPSTSTSPDSNDDTTPHPLLLAAPVTGKCYVLTFSPAHNLTLADLAPAAILPIVRAWTAIYAAHLSPSSPLHGVHLGQPPSPDSTAALEAEAKALGLTPPAAQYRYMQIFENKGAAMGCSNPHPHGQIWTTTGTPEEPALELAALQKYRAEHGGKHMLGEYAALESARGVRVVCENAAWVAVCPWWATWPFEVLVLARRHVRALVDLQEGEREGLAEVLGEVARRYDNLFETQFPYSMGLHQAPLEGTAEEVEASWLHVHFYPPLLRSATVRKFLVGYELLAEPQRDITPEQAAARLRACGGELYRNKLE